MFAATTSKPGLSQAVGISAEIAILKSLQWVPGERNYQPEAGAVQLDVVAIEAIVVPKGPEGPWTKYLVSVMGEGGVVDDNGGLGYQVSIRKGVSPNAKRLTIQREVATRDEQYKFGKPTVKGITKKYFLYEA